MKNAIIWNPINHNVFANIFLNAFGMPFMLTCLDDDWISDYYSKEFPPFLDDLFGVPQFNEKWTIKAKPFHGENWKLIQPNNIESFIDLLRISERSGDKATLFSNDIDANRLKSWIEKREKEQFEIKKVFNLSYDFVKEPKLITSFSQCIVLHGFLTSIENNDFLIVSNDNKLLDLILESAALVGEVRLPDYTDSLTFGKSFDDNVIFITDLDLVIQNRLKSEN